MPDDKIAALVKELHREARVHDVSKPEGEHSVIAAIIRDIANRIEAAASSPQREARDELCSHGSPRCAPWCNEDEASKVREFMRSPAAGAARVPDREALARIIRQHNLDRDGEIPHWSFAAVDAVLAALGYPAESGEGKP